MYKLCCFEFALQDSRVGWHITNGCNTDLHLQQDNGQPRVSIHFGIISQAIYRHRISWGSPAMAGNVQSFAEHQINSLKTTDVCIYVLEPLITIISLFFFFRK
jgi:hypothetical protein